MRQIEKLENLYKKTHQSDLVENESADHDYKTYIIYDDYNGRIRKDQNTIGTLTTNVGNDAMRNGFKLIEICGD